MSWNYRVVKTKGGNLAIREVYYDDEGELQGTTDDIAPISEDVEGLKWVLKRMLKACDKPVVDPAKVWGEE